MRQRELGRRETKTGHTEPFFAQTATPIPTSVRDTSDESEVSLDAFQLHREMVFYGVFARAEWRRLFLVAWVVWHFVR